MILQEEFEKCGYQDILVDDRASEYKINLDDIFDIEHKPAELLGVYISKQRDELFLLLDGDIKDINDLCDYWDHKIRVFNIINDKTEEIHKLKYNIVQLIVCSGVIPDRRMEGNLLITRKIIIGGNKTDKKQISIDDNESIELPFHMISADEYEPDADKITRLNQLLPQDGKVSELLKKRLTKKYETSKTEVTVKSLSDTDYESIKGWLDNDNT